MCSLTLIFLILMLGSRKYVVLLHKASKGLDTMKQIIEAGKVVPVVEVATSQARWLMLCVMLQQVILKGFEPFESVLLYF